ncbi:MAG: 3,4-dihydroxy 2-butanone 4-phosphate synthase / cyclohydrolase [Gaiellaceae bacterium]|nr:3,4-dihydroxy 2-butanone 4-phosphate synthase / cyclohydrolase [Gaiellaceae bacterium]
MFTGIVRERGRVASAVQNGGGVHLRIEAAETASGAEPGDSVAVAGCCLTVTIAGDGALEFDAVPETLARTTLGRLEAGSHVNLEPALRAGEPLGGHFVQGHVDGRGHVVKLEPEGDGARLNVVLDPGLSRYCVEKGSVAIDGVSLTIAALQDDGVEIALVPFTLEHTTLAGLRAGDEVNVEVDLLAKYAERLVSA